MSHSKPGPQPWLCLSAFQQTEDFRNPRYGKFYEWEDPVELPSDSQGPQHEAPPDKVQRIESLGFLDLPPQLRNRIYEHLLIVPETLSFGYDSQESRFWHYAPRVHAFRDIQHNILATCRTVHQEPTPVLYGANVFEAISEYIDAFDTSIGRNVSHLRHVKTLVFISLDLDVPKKLHKANSLEILEIRVSPMLKVRAEQIERFVGVLCAWIKAQRLERAGTKKKDPTEVLRIVPRTYGQKVDEKAQECVDEIQKVLAQKLRKM